MAASRRRAAAAQLLSCSGLLFIGLWLCWDGLDATGATALQTAPGGLRVARPANAVLVTPARRKQSQLLPSTPAVGPAVAVGAAGQRRAPRSPATLFDSVLQRCCWLALLATTLSTIAVLVRRALPPSPRPTPLWVCAVQGDVAQQTSGGHLHTSGREAQQVEALEFEEAAKLRGETNVLPSKQAAGDKEPAQSRKEEQGRTVFVGHLPLTTTQAELKLSFPTAERIFIRRGRIYACAFVTFGTVEAATSVASLTKMELAGNTVSVFLQGDKETAKRRMKEEQSRTIFIGAMPLATTQAELEQSFPTAERIAILRGKYDASAFVVFGTVEAATNVASQAKMELAGHTVYFSSADDKETIQRKIKEEQSRTVFVWCLPPTTTQAELKQSFPTAERITIRQRKLQAFASLVFSTVEAATSVASQAKTELAGHTVYLGFAGNHEATHRRMKEEQSRTMYIAALPLATTQAELEQCFPTAERIALHQGKFHASAFVIFGTVEAATTVASQAKMELAGHTVYFSLAGGKKVAQRRIKEEQSRTVFIGSLPPTTTQAELKQSFPTAERIIIRRRKLQACAFVIFSTVEAATNVASQAKTELVGLTVDLYNKERWLAIQKEHTARTVIMSRLPTAVCEATLNQCYPTAEAINLVQTGPHTNAFVRFPTAEEAEAMASQATAIIDGQTVALRMAGSKKALGQKRGPPAATANA